MKSISRALRPAAAPVVLATLAACAGALSPSAPSVVIPDALRAPAGETLLRTLSADGVQIYECRARADGADWVFVAPEARLYDAQGTWIGKHYAGPTWEAADGSKVVGAVKAKVDSPDAGAIPWLLWRPRRAARRRRRASRRACRTRRSTRSTRRASRTSLQRARSSGPARSRSKPSSSCFLADR
jgi:hypothetical protein